MGSRIGALWFLALVALIGLAAAGGEVFLGVEADLLRSGPSNLKKDVAQCQSDPIKVHLIPHTHNDVGAGKTVDQYYYGASEEIEEAGVQYILDSVVEALLNDETKRFIYVELAYFERWWNEQSDALKKKVRKLVKNGQLEFINGGYVQNDEAAAYYEDIIDQMTLGHQFLLREFGVIPTIAWQTDTYGHSSAQAALAAQMGFDGLFFFRIDHVDMDLRKANQSLEMDWTPRTSQGAENKIFTHVNYFRDEDPLGFCFDITCTDTPVKDDARLEGFNIDQKAADLVNYFRTQCEHYQTNTLMHTVGGGFTFRLASQNFKNWDKLMSYINGKDDFNMKLIYSTPSAYVKEVRAIPVQWPTKADDFFPYSDRVNGYWTGYYSSRTALKGYIRQVSHLSQAFRKFATNLLITGAAATYKKSILATVGVLDRALAINQHHDAVTGTSKQAVVEDYKRMLGAGVIGVESVLSAMLIDIYKAKTGQFYFCNTNLSASQCAVTNEELKAGRDVILAVLNPARNRSSPIRVKVPTAFLDVLGPNGKSVPADVICANATDTNDCDLYFQDTFNVLEPVLYRLRPSTTSLLVKGEKTIPPFASSRTLKLSPAHKFTIDSNFTDFVHDVCDDSGKNCKEYKWRTQYKYYQSNVGDQNSGAKVFRPDNATWNASKVYAKGVNSTLYQGKTVVQINIHWGKIVSDIRFVLADLDYFEIESFIDSIDVTDGIGKELTINFQTMGLTNNATFYTDSNGMEFQRRVTNKRETWDWKADQPAAGNYYPVSSAIYLEDVSKNQRFAVLNDRAQGGGVIHDGEIELMIHRRILTDDGHGIGEPLNEIDWDGQGLRQRVRHFVLHTPAKENITTIRILQGRIDQPDLFMVGRAAAMLEETGTTEPQLPKVLGDFVPKLVKFYLIPQSDSYIVRFHNMDDQNTITFDRPPFMASFSSVVETSLTGNQAKAQMMSKRSDSPQMGRSAESVNDEKITLRALEIKTFVLSNSTST